MRRPLFIALLLAGITLAVYWPAGTFEVVFYDDTFFTDNPAVQSGLNGHSLRWALTSVVAANWHPVTSLSFVLTHQFFGNHPGAEHMVNVLIHAANAALLFLLLGRLTASQIILKTPAREDARPTGTATGTSWWQCAVVAAIFAWHPLRVESVAWIAERKDLLCAFFFLLSLLAYARWAQGGGDGRWQLADGSWEGREKRKAESGNILTAKAPEAQRGHGGGVGRWKMEDGRKKQEPATCNLQRAGHYYWLALGFFALALLSKPMAVTLPFVLLLLDGWPLGRGPGKSGKRKAESGNGDHLTPTLSPASGGEGEKGKAEDGGWKMAVGSWQLAVGAKLKAGGGGRNWKRLVAEKIPFLALTAVFCAVTLAVQHGENATASLQELGLGLRLENVVVSYLRYLGWTLWPANLAMFYSFPYDDHFYLALWPGWQIGAGLLALAGITILCLTQWPRRPYLALGWFWYLGMMVPVIGLVQVGSQGMADRYTYLPLIGPVISAVWLAAEIWRAGFFPKIFLSTLVAAVLGAGIFQTRHQLQFWKNTDSLCRHTIAVTGENPRAEYIAGLGAEQAGRSEEALAHYRNAVSSQPRVKEAFYALGRIFGQRGEWSQAEATYRARLGDDPNDFPAQLGLANTLPHLGRKAEAITHLQTARQNCPDTPDALNNLAWTLATHPEAELRDGAHAVALAERACKLSGDQEIIMVGTLGAAYAEAGRFEEAIATAQKACALATAQGKEALLKINRRLLELYRQQQPVRE